MIPSAVVACDETFSIMYPPAICALLYCFDLSIKGPLLSEISTEET